MGGKGAVVRVQGAGRKLMADRPWIIAYGYWALKQFWDMRLEC
ncbi:conserved hypothetical protein [delta proteobacterium NaphS2]|nr:conserved hypothetical protein [delta proteobacterium NaphS2]